MSIIPRPHGIHTARSTLYNHASKSPQHRKTVRHQCGIRRLALLGAITCGWLLSSIGMGHASPSAGTGQWSTQALPATTLIGVQQQIPVGDEPSTGEQMAALWQRFQTMQSLHLAVDWSATVELYALYTGFDVDSPTIAVTVGYPEAALRRTARPPEWVVQALPQGDYVDYTGPATQPEHANQQSRVLGGWQQLDPQRLPVAVLERYRVSPEGAISKADLLVLYHQPE